MQWQLRGHVACEGGAETAGCFLPSGAGYAWVFHHCFDIVAEQDAIVYRLELCVSLSAAENPGVLSDGGVNASLAGYFGAVTR